MKDNYPNLSKAQPQDSGRFQRKRDLMLFLTLARNSFAKGKFDLAADYCRQIIESCIVSKMDEIAYEAYYLWCLANLNLSQPEDVRKVCYDARSKYGNYLDLIYFELLSWALSGNIEKVIKFCETYLAFYENSNHAEMPLRSRTAEKYTEVKIMLAQSLDEKGDHAKAYEVYQGILAKIGSNPDIELRIARLKDKLSIALNEDQNE